MKSVLLHAVLGLLLWGLYTGCMDWYLTRSNIVAMKQAQQIAAVGSWYVMIAPIYKRMQDTPQYARAIVDSGNDEVRLYRRPNYLARPNYTFRLSLSRNWAELCRQAEANGEKVSEYYNKAPDMPASNFYTYQEYGRAIRVKFVFSPPHQIDWEWLFVPGYSTIDFLKQQIIK
ncbi:MAG: hypothetical protein NTY30_04590 [Candidatus Berkelbacteria bacterium]|nr:hypothetical protein [Candidatus Berkelbacteria bacterium]